MKSWLLAVKRAFAELAQAPLPPNQREPASATSTPTTPSAGCRTVTGDLFVTTDGDTMLDRRFVERGAPHFSGPRVAAVCGYVESLRHNGRTAACLGSERDETSQPHCERAGQTLRGRHQGGEHGMLPVCGAALSASPT